MRPVTSRMSSFHQKMPVATRNNMLKDRPRLSFRGGAGDEESRTALRMAVPKAPWSAVSVSRRTATAFSPGFQGGSFAAPLQGASRPFSRFLGAVGGMTDCVENTQSEVSLRSE
jgi:hypothetical protein